MSDELIHHMRGFAEECLRRIELNPEVSGNELHTKQTYVDIMKLCDRVPAAPQSDPLTKEAEAKERHGERCKQEMHNKSSRLSRARRLPHWI